MNEVETLKGVRDLLADPARWTKGAFARVSPEGRCIGAVETNATCWCIRGAVIKASGGFGTESHRSAEEVLCKSMCIIQGAPFIEAVPAALAWFNDEPHRRHEEVMKVIDFAIQTEEAKANA